MTIFEKNTAIESSIPRRMDKYVIYLRKSRADVEAEKLGEGETLTRHKKILTELAARKGLYVEKIYEEIVSGETIEARPEIQKMIQECYDGKYKGILIVEVTRLSRGSQGDAQTILDCLKYSNRNNGVLVITPTKTYDVAHSQEDEEYMEFELFMSRREYKMIQKRMDRGRKQAVVEGNYMGSYRPYGFDILKTRTSRTLTPNPNEAPIVKQIYEWSVKDNYTPGQIMRKLIAMGVPTYTGAPEWSIATVKDIIKNPVYIGKVRWNHRMRVKTMKDGHLVSNRPRSNDTDHYMLYDGKHEALIDEETYNKANERFSSDKTKYTFELKNVLAGMLVCPKCGKAMAYRGYESRTNTAPRILHSYSQKCKVKSALYDDVVNAVIHCLKLYIEDFEMKVSNIPDTNENAVQNQIVMFEKEEKKIKRKLERLFNSWEEELISDNEFVSRKAVHAERLENIKDEIAKLEDSIPEKEEYSEQIIKLSEALELIKDPLIDISIKNSYLKTIVDKIEFSRENNSEFILDITLR